MIQALNMVPSRLFAYTGLLFISVVLSWVMAGIIVSHLKERFC